MTITNSGGFVSGESSDSASGAPVSRIRLGGDSFTKAGSFTVSSMVTKLGSR